MVEKIKKNETFNKIIRCLSDCTFFDGTYTRLEFASAIFFTAWLISLPSYFEINSLDTLGSIVFLYVALSASQKRCRDIGITGTPIILIISIFLVYADIFQPSDMYKSGIFRPITTILLIVYILTLFYELLYPGKEEKNPELTSPLLKYPRAYFVFCVILILVGRHVVENYNLY